jgi:hypothetical protein
MKISDIQKVAKSNVLSKLQTTEAGKWAAVIDEILYAADFDEVKIKDTHSTMRRVYALAEKIRRHPFGDVPMDPCEALHKLRDYLETVAIAQLLDK